MNKPTSTPVLIAAFAAIVMGAAVTLAAVGILFYPRQNSVSADSSTPAVLTASTSSQAPAPDDDTPLSTPPPLPTVTPIVIPTVTPVKIPVVAAVKPVQPVDSGLPVICQSQSYTPEREAQCPHSAPVRQVSQSDLSAPATPTVTSKSILPPTPTATPAPVTTPTPSPVSTPKPTATPAPTPTAAPPAPRDCGGYPALLCNSARDSLVDPWGMYNRECVSYAAYKVSLRRVMPNWGGHGNAFQWPANARAAGIPVDNRPKAGDVAILTTGFGHAMYVEAVNGSYITVSQFNYDDTSEFSRLAVPSAGLEFIHF
ncbi:MAG: hypothetical protein NVSMB39_1750 [Candidatus Saccharimonadales bacterium]